MDRTKYNEALYELQKQNTQVRAAEKKVVEAAERQITGFSRLPLHRAVIRLRAARERQAKAREQLDKIKRSR